MRILCVGSSGFLGGYLVNRLVQEKHQVSCMDLAVRENAKRISNLPLEKYLWKSAQDTTEKDLIGLDAIIYLAAVADVPLAISSPTYTFEQNTKGVQRVCEVLKDMPEPASLLYLSSESIYGKQTIIPVPETAPVRAANIYGASKLAAENIVLTYHESYPHMDVCVARSSTMFGPYSRPKQMIPIFLNKALKNEPIPVDGGDQSRDMNYVENTVDGIMAALHAPADEVSGEIFNIASGKELSVKTIAEKCIEVTGSKSQIEYRPYREGEKGLQLALDISKARKVLRYSPNVDFSTGLQTTAAWVHDLVFPSE